MNIPCRVSPLSLVKLHPAELVNDNYVLGISCGESKTLSYGKVHTNHKSGIVCIISYSRMNIWYISNHSEYVYDNEAQEHCVYGVLNGTYTDIMTVQVHGIPELILYRFRTPIHNSKIGYYMEQQSSHPIKKITQVEDQDTMQIVFDNGTRIYMTINELSKQKITRLEHVVNLD